MIFDRTTLITCVGVEHDLPMLPHFLRHYLTLGIRPERMLVILNAGSNDSPCLAQARRILKEHGLPAPIEWIAPYTSGDMWAQRRYTQSSYCDLNDWVISADVDELHTYPIPLEAFLKWCEEQSIDCVQGVMIDRLASGGQLLPVDSTPDLAEQFPVRAEAALSIAGKGAWHNRTGTVKLMVMKAHILPGIGGHRPWKGQEANHIYAAPLEYFSSVERPDFRFAVPTCVEHFHWTKTLPDRLRIRIDTPGVSEAGAEYGQKQIDHIDANNGINLDQIAIFTPKEENWQNTVTRMQREGRRLLFWARITALRLRIKTRIRKFL